jgi:hypothetical protein
MCLSAQASFVSGAVVGGFGLAVLPWIRSWREVLLGILPLLFAVHQVEEGMVWLYLEDHVSRQVGDWSVRLYILYAHVLLPTIIPLSLCLPEPDSGRRRWIALLVVLGACLSGFALGAISREPIFATIRNHSIEYHDALFGKLWFAILDGVATCVPPFLSSYRWMIRFGVLIIAALIIMAVFKTMYLTSVWCAVAALVSVLIYLHFRMVRGSAAKAASGPA